MATLRVNTQTDRLPDVDTKLQIAVRVSAAVDEIDATPLPIANAIEVMPWKWKTAGGDWTPHKADAWRVWRVRGGAGVEVKSGIASLLKDPANFDINGFRTRVEQDIQSIVDTSGVKEAVQWPGGKPVASRIVLGVVEGLTALPHPVPVAMGVFSVLEIDPAATGGMTFEKTDRFIAAPVFRAANGGVYLPVDDPTQAGDEWTTELKEDKNAQTQPPFANGKIHLHPSWTAAELEPVAGRLIDLKTMLVRKPGNTGLFDEDWATHLASRISEIVDPAPRVMAVLDDTIKAGVSETGGDGQRKTGQALIDAIALKTALRTDLERRLGNGDQHSLRALDVIQWSLLSQRTVAAAASPAPALAIVAAQPLRDSALRSSATALAWGYGDRKSPGHFTDLPPRTEFASVPASRLAALVDLPPDSERVNTDADSIDDETAFKRWVLARWLMKFAKERELPLLGGGRRTLNGSRRTLRNDQAFPPKSEDIPIVDLRFAPGGPAIEVPFAFTLDPDATLVQLLRLSLLSRSAIGEASVEVTITRQGATGEVTIVSGGDTHKQSFSDAGANGARTLVFVVTFTVPEKGRVTIAARVVRGATQQNPATLEKRAELFGEVFAALRGDSHITNAGLSVNDIALSTLEAAIDPVLIASTARRELSLASAGPYLTGIIAGRDTWTTSWTPPATPLPTLTQRLEASIMALVGGPDKTGAFVLGPLFAEELAKCQKALAGIPDDAEKTRETLEKLFASLFKAAALDAVARIRAAVPGDRDALSRDPLDRISADARPLVFLIDQLQSFSPTDDIWSRLAGLGVLIGRSGNINDVPKKWQSLSLATLHLPPKPDKGFREEPSDLNAVKVRDGTFAASAIVDPVALVVSENAGVRSALISYDNRSIVGKMVSDARVQTTQSGDPSTRRFEAYGHPPADKTTYRLPALSFGFAYHVVPYVIAHGGVLPPGARKKTGDNAVLELNKTDIAGLVDLGGTNIADVRRAALYRRTRPVGVPRLFDDKLPAIPPGVAALAGELSVRSAPITIESGTTTRFFLDKEGARGTIDMPPATGRKLALRLDIVDIGPLDKNPTLTVTLVGLPPGQTKPEAFVVSVKPTALRVRVDVFGARTLVSQAPRPALAEDEPAFGPPQEIKHSAAEIAKRLDEWREIYVELKTDQTINLEAPLATIVESFDTRIEPITKTLMAPEANPQARAISVLDGIGPLSASKPTVKLRVRRPPVDFGTYERWVNPPIFELPINEDNKTKVIKAINAARARAIAAPTDKGVDRTCDDPAVSRLYAEFVRIFPEHEVLNNGVLVRVGREFTSLDDILKLESSPASLSDLTIAVDANEGVVTSETPPTFRCKPGCIYEVRVYAAIDEMQASLSKKATGERFAAAVSSLFRRYEEKGGSGETIVRRLGTPLTLTFEIATEAMPKRDDETPVAIDAVLRRPPDVSLDHALIRLSTDELKGSGPVSNKQAYVNLRYVDRVALFSQRWSWRGRPQADLWPRKLDTNDGKVSDELKNLFDVAFVDRGDHDVGDIIERRLTRSHVYGGRARIEEEVDASRIPTILEKSLDYRGGVNLWRFGLREMSRYQAMRPNSAALVQITHLRKRDRAQWLLRALADRPKGRALKRPALALVLPLTEPYMADGAVPPLMALFNEQMFSNFHAADGIEVSVEVARHPLMTAQPKYRQEFGPDPVRTKRASDGLPIALRADGPLGYTHDLETEAGRFDHAALFISPVGQKSGEIAPWSLMKLRFRRLEAPEGIDARIGVLADGPLPKAQLALELCSARPLKKGAYRLVNSEAISRAVGRPNLADAENATERHLAVDGVSIFPTAHEGLVIDVADVRDVRNVFIVSFDDPKKGGHVRVEIVEASAGGSGRDRQLTLTFDTDLGSAGTWTQTFPNGVKASVRLIVSAREKPLAGEKYKPAGDVDVRVRLGNDAATDAIRRLEQNHWLSVTCLPLRSDTEVPIGPPPVVHIDGEFAEALANPADSEKEPGENVLSIRSVRLSAFTTGTWCQFAESMSVFSATFDGAPNPVRVSTADLVTKVDGKQLHILYENPGAPKTLKRLAPLDRIDGEAQIESVMYVVLTRFITDVFDRAREKPIAVFRWPADGGSIDLTHPLWPDPKVPVDLAASGGRVRFMRVSRSKGQPFGFETVDDAQTAPTGLFDFAMLGPVGSPVEMNPRDARGVTLGMSKPVEWRG